MRREGLVGVLVAVVRCRSSSCAEADPEAEFGTLAPHIADYFRRGRTRRELLEPRLGRVAGISGDSGRWCPRPKRNLQEDFLVGTASGGDGSQDGSGRSGRPVDGQRQLLPEDFQPSRTLEGAAGCGSC